MRIILDTNVLVSGIFFTGPPHKILQAWKVNKVQIVISPDIYFEYARVAEVISQKHPNIDISGIIKLIAVHAEIIQSSSLLEHVCEDLDDEKFIACALLGHVEYIISGDHHLLKLNGYKNIRIMKPSVFSATFLK